jgi:two-component system, OmpR family, alkaline phosphatase synthesis response regulator PhoP
LSSILIVAQDNETANKIKAELALGFNSSVSLYSDKLVDRVIHDLPELILLDVKGMTGLSALHELTDGSKIPRTIPIMTLISPDLLNNPVTIEGASDFVLSPFIPEELLFRIKRLIRKNRKEEDLLRCDDLVVDLANCEVRVGGKVVELTFKEYELLKFLAKDRGRVFTRETLLNKVWGYDYFGGDRTVDVHIRRLRSKIEIGDRSYIETVRNIGYRFKKDGK